MEKNDLNETKENESSASKLLKGAVMAALVAGNIAFGSLSVDLANDKHAQEYTIRERDETIKSMVIKKAEELGLSPKIATQTANEFIVDMQYFHEQRRLKSAPIVGNIDERINELHDIIENFENRKGNVSKEMYAIAKKELEEIMALNVEYNRLKNGKGNKNINILNTKHYNIHAGATGAYTSQMADEKLKKQKNIGMDLQK